jgi:hypothetical protein
VLTGADSLGLHRAKAYAAVPRPESGTLQLLLFVDIGASLAISPRAQSIQ